MSSVLATVSTPNGAPVPLGLNLPKRACAMVGAGRQLPESGEQFAAEAVSRWLKGRCAGTIRDLQFRRLAPALPAFPLSASSRIMSPSRTLPIAPPSSASGVTWIAAGTLPACARHAAVGDQRHLVAAVLQHAEHRGQLVQFRHAVGLRSLEADDGDEVAVELARP